jgi:hypothetical protein
VFAGRPSHEGTDVSNDWSVKLEFSQWQPVGLFAQKTCTCEDDDPLLHAVTRPVTNSAATKPLNPCVFFTCPPRVNACLLSQLDGAGNARSANSYQACLPQEALFAILTVLAR